VLPGSAAEDRAPPGRGVVGTHGNFLTLIERKVPPKTNIGRRRAANARESSEFYQERHQEILRAAGLAFQEKGFQATTIADIAEKLGTDRASVYYYFGSKNELLQEGVREATIKNVTEVEAIAGSNRPAPEKLRLALVAQMETYRTSYPYLHVFLQEKFPALSRDRSSWNKEIRQLSDRYYQAFYRIIEQGVQNGEFENDLPIELVTLAAIGMVNWAHRWYKPEGKWSAERIGDGFAAIALKGLLSKKAR
jgi:AcrR family transcriptional regulator